MKTSFFVVALVLALACLAAAQPAKRNATASAADEPMMAPKRNATTVAGAVKNATATAVGKARNATGTGAAAAEPAAGTKASPSPSPAPKASGASVATTGFAAAVAGSVLLLQLVL